MEEDSKGDEEEVQVVEERSSSTSTSSSGSRGGAQQARPASGDDGEEVELEEDGGLPSWAMGATFPLATPQGYSEYDHCRVAVRVYSQRAIDLYRKGRLQMKRAWAIL